MDQQLQKEQSVTPERALKHVYRALTEKGYDPSMQIVGYLLTEDPTYITNFDNARALIGGIDRDELLTEIVGFYFESKCGEGAEE